MKASSPLTKIFGKGTFPFARALATTMETDDEPVIEKEGEHEQEQEHSTTPPAEDAPSLPRVSSPSCDETIQKPGEDLGRKTPVHEAGKAKGNDKSGEKAVAKGLTIQFSSSLPTSANRAATQKLRERYRKPETYSFPTYGNPKNGVPISDPMVSQNLKALLSGDFKTKNNIDSRGLNSLSKRPAQSQTTCTEPTRSSKRQKREAEIESPSSIEYSEARFAVARPAATSSNISSSLKASSVVDLTESQKSKDGDLASNRSENEPPLSAGVSEYRQMVNATKNGSTNKRPRCRKLLSQETPPKQFDLSSEDELLEPPSKKRNGVPPKTTLNKPFQLAKCPRISSEGISDCDLQQIEELAEETNGKSQRVKSDAILDDDARMSPITPGKHIASADMSRVNFSKKGGESDSLVFRLKRAVAAPAHVRIDTDLGGKQGLTLRADNYALRAFDSNGKPRDDYHWLEVKLNLCNEIRYTLSNPAIAFIIRATKRRSPLVLEFAESGDAHKFGLWAEKKSAEQSILKAKINTSDSAPLEKILEKQWNDAIKYKSRPGTEPDDIKHLENKEASSSNKHEQNLSRNGTRPTLPQQYTPYGSKTPLRSGMTSTSSASGRHPTKKTTSSYFSHNLDDETSGPAEPRRSTRQMKDTRSRHVSDSQPSRASPKSPSQVSWTVQNPDWEEIWDEKPLIFPASGKNRTTIYKDDISRLEEGEFMNDNLIGFYCRYLQVKLEQENNLAADRTATRIYFMNTYFYPKLTEKRGRGINYDGVKTWTAKVDLFSYDYIVVPVNEQAHWYLAIICHPSRLIKSEENEANEVDSALFQELPKEGLFSSAGEQLEQMSLENVEAKPNKSETETREANTLSVRPHASVKKSSGTVSRKKDPSEARVITLDSLGTGHSSTCGNLKDFLIHEALDKKKLEIEPPAQFGMTAKNIPQQIDHASCGAFLLYYLREFLKNPDEVVRKIVLKDNLCWQITSLEMRSELRSIIIDQRKDQNKRNAKLAAEKRAKKKFIIQTSASSRSPEKELSGPPATPTPTAIGELFKKPSSTIKGSSPLASKFRSSSCSRKETDDDMTALEEIQAPQWSTAVTGSVREGKDAPHALRSNSPEQLNAPSRYQPLSSAASLSIQMPSSPRHNKSKIASSASKSQAAGPGPASLLETRSISPTEPVSDCSKKVLISSQPLIDQLPSPYKDMPVRAEKRASEQLERGDSSSQQLRGELQTSPAQFVQVGLGASAGARTEDENHHRTIKDRESSKNSDLRNPEAGPTQISPHFPAPNSSPTEETIAKSPSVRSKSARSPPERWHSRKSPPSSAKGLRQSSMEEVPRLSVENAETYDRSPGTRSHKSRQYVTVDLTD